MAEGGFTGYPAGSRGLRRVEVALFAAGLATFALLYSTQPLLPELVTYFDISPATSALSVSLTTLGLGARAAGGGSCLGGGRPHPADARLAAGLSVLGLAVAVAPSWHALLALRALQGVALAGLPAVAVAYLREEVHDSVYGRAAGLYIAGNASAG